MEVKEIPWKFSEAKNFDKKYAGKLEFPEVWRGG